MVSTESQDLPAGFWTSLLSVLVLGLQIGGEISYLQIKVQQ